jgi:L-amino acid N-acyltransferase YncA
MEPAIRTATQEDAEQIAEIIEEVLAEGRPVAFTEPMSSEAVRAWIERQGDSGTMIVVDDGRFIRGFASIDFDSSQPGECTFGAWVRARYRRQGNGTALAEEALAFARQHGYRRIRGRLPEQNEPALSSLSAIGALVPLTNPGASFELPVYHEDDTE